MHLKHIFAIMFAGLIMAQAKSADLISPESQWHYYQKSGKPAETWLHSGYDHQQWKTGFAELGYGDGEESTVIAFGDDADNKSITQYFAKYFTVEDISSVDALKLKLLADDGAVVYLNGKEALRFNMPTEHQHNTLALDSPIESIWVEHSLPNSLLTQGENLIAVEVHQVSPKSSDLSFDLALTYTPVNSLLSREFISIEQAKPVQVSVTEYKVFSDLYLVDITQQKSSLSFAISGGSGDADIYVRHGEPPTLTDWDYRPSRPGNEETVVIKGPVLGTYYVALYAYKAFADVTLITY